MKLELTQEELNIITAALIEMPFKHVAKLLNKIQEQINEQNKVQ